MNEAAPPESDYFSLLSLPRHPWVDPVVLKANYHKAAAGRHPDHSGGQTARFVELGEAVSCLKDPATRLRHLLQLTFPEASGGAKKTPDPEVFARVSEVLREASSALTKVKIASSTLGQAAARAAVKSARAGVQRELKKLQAARGELDALCRNAGANWAERGADFWFTQATRARFYGKWQRELEDKLFALQEIPGA